MKKKEKLSDKVIDCPKCNGTGKIGTSTCTQCNGTGKVTILHG